MRYRPHYLLFVHAHTSHQASDCFAARQAAWQWLSDRHVDLAASSCGDEGRVVGALARCWTSGDPCLGIGSWRLRVSGPMTSAGAPSRVAVLMDSQWPLVEMLAEVERTSVRPEVLMADELRRLAWDGVLAGRGSVMVEALTLVDAAGQDEPAKMVGLAMAGEALGCHAVTRGRGLALDGFEAILSWLRPRNASLDSHSGWPMFSLLARLRHALRSPLVEADVVVSWSSEEAAHLGGNFAERMAQEIFGALDGVVVESDIECADVWFFREHPPRNFGGVSVFVDGETHWKNSGVAHYDEYPLGLYLGPRDHNGAFGDRFFYAPFASTSFAQRQTHSVEILVNGSRLPLWRSKTKFAAYMSHNCGSAAREEFYNALAEAAAPYGLEVAALSRCNGSGVPRDLGRRAERYGSNFYDDAVEIYTPYKFVIAMENRMVPGYVTEKIVNAFLAGAIPIYYGDSAVDSLFNRESFIDLADFEDFRSAAEFVVSLNFNESAALRFVETSVFAGEDGLYPFSWHGPLSRALPDGGLGGAIRRRITQLLAEVRSNEAAILGRAFSEETYMSFTKGAALD
ncbi:Alpha (1,3) fucosyltransferase [Perkinsus olseni]|uniref:Fucosyltransferase n=1 Tax=Perkinsus olseni TaxID=32597 RepID=A0A7J6QED0_PEROL|nr:Alpha (1,3) fucosyltransferase [Perkinsus olseni]